MENSRKFSCNLLRTNEQIFHSVVSEKNSIARKAINNTTAQNELFIEQRNNTFAGFHYAISFITQLSSYLLSTTHAFIATAYAIEMHNLKIKASSE